MKPVFTVNELAALLELDRFKTWRLVRAAKIPVIRVGKSILIPLAGFARTYPDLWASIAVARGLSPDTEVVCECCGSTQRLGDMERAS